MACARDQQKPGLIAPWRGDPVSTAKVGIVQVGVGQIDVDHVGAAQVDSVQVGAAQAGFEQVRFRNLRVPEVRLSVANFFTPSNNSERGLDVARVGSSLRIEGIEGSLTGSMLNAPD